MGCIAWFAIRPTGSTTTITRQGTFGLGTAWWLFFPTMALDSSVNMVFNYTRSGTDATLGHPSAASTIIGSTSGFGPGYTQGFGSFAYVSGTPSRWGDFSSVFLDPTGATAGRSFCMASETLIAANRWGTHLSCFQSAGS